MAKKELPKVPTISFNAPHWELVFDRKLALGFFGVKTRKDDKYSHRGLVLCYTGLKSHLGPVHSYDLDEDTIPRGVVGCANLVGLRELREWEKAALFGGYNNFSWEHQLGYTEHNCHFLLDRYKRPRASAIYPMDYGYLFDKVHRFKKPFTPPEQIMYGPVGLMPLYPEIAKQLPSWAKKLL